ncbi:ribosomal biogenesis factor [Protopterus annectens]|uniref:ribosomal biogenesis factor n=1 Tax=Protopterus annectens TaxID=7888 RepID=UPI001CFB1360|nr:ribosomal biogenesis factor [Protopterus annectens]XP_043921930.1 ribosomal biogenesis factor [Protopterus annectens]
MAKNKSKVQKKKDVFQVANKKQMKAKNKAKPVTTNLKKLNALNDEKVSDVNKSFVELQREVKSLSKGCSSEPKTHQLVCPSDTLEINVEDAAKLFSHL